MAQTSLSLAVYMLERDYTRNKNARREREREKKHTHKKKTAARIFDSSFHRQICGILIKRPEKLLERAAENEEFFHSGHMRGVHRNACLTYLFIASNSLVV